MRHSGDLIKGELIMKNNFVAKHAQRSGSGFHEDKSKPDKDSSDLTVYCLTCHEYSDILFVEYECPLCGSKLIKEIGGLS